MKGFHPYPLSAQDQRENWRITSEVLEELYFKPVMLPGMGAFDAVGTQLSVATGTASVEFTNGAAIAAWRVEMRRRGRWQKAQVRVTVTYTATVGSTAGFHLALITREHGPGSIVPGSAILATSLTLPGPAVALTEMTTVYVSPGSAINGAKPNISFVIARDPASADDTNANSLHVLSVEWEVMPL